MLSFFPELLYLSPFAGFLIRLALSLVFAVSAWKRIRSDRMMLLAFGGFDALLALAFFLGYLTQLAALIAILCTLYWLARPLWSPFPRSTAALALVMALCLLVLGAGPFAFDLPL